MMAPKTSTVLATLAALVAAVAVAQTPPPNSPSAAPADAPTTATAPAAEATASEPEVVCRKVKSTGSRVRQETVCITRGGSAAAREWLRNQQNQALPRASDADVNGGG